MPNFHTKHKIIETTIVCSSNDIEKFIRVATFFHSIGIRPCHACSSATKFDNKIRFATTFIFLRAAAQQPNLKRSVKYIVGIKHFILENNGKILQKRRWFAFKTFFLFQYFYGLRKECCTFWTVIFFGRELTFCAPNFELFNRANNNPWSWFHFPAKGTRIDRTV